MMSPAGVLLIPPTSTLGFVSYTSEWSCAWVS